MEDFEELPKMAGWHEAKLAQPLDVLVITSKLRFVERKDFTEDAANPRTLRILQQWWASTTKFGSGQWRDIPLEEESK